MSDNNITFAQYLIKLGAKKNWFPEGSAKFYFSRVEHSRPFREIGICSQSFLSNFFYNSKNYLEIDKIFPKNSKNLYSFNFVTVDESNLPYHKGGIGAVLLKSKGSFQEIAVNFHLAINEIEKKDIVETVSEGIDEYEKHHNKSNDYDYRWYEEIFNKHKINLQKVHYPEKDNSIDAGKLFLNEGKIYFLKKPYLNGEYYFLWGDDEDYKYFLPQKMLEDINYVYVSVNDFKV